MELVTILALIGAALGAVAACFWWALSVLFGLATPTEHEVLAIVVIVAVMFLVLFCAAALFFSYRHDKINQRTRK